MGNLGREALVVHKNNIYVSHIRDQKLLESVWQEVAGLKTIRLKRHRTKGTLKADLLIATITNLGTPHKSQILSNASLSIKPYLWHSNLALEPPAYSVVNTLWLPP